MTPLRLTLVTDLHADLWHSGILIVIGNRLWDKLSPLSHRISFAVFLFAFHYFLFLVLCSIFRFSAPYCLTSSTSSATV